MRKEQKTSQSTNTKFCQNQLSGIVHIIMNLNIINRTDSRLLTQIIQVFLTSKDYKEYFLIKLIIEFYNVKCIQFKFQGCNI